MRPKIVEKVKTMFVETGAKKKIRCGKRLFAVANAERKSVQGQERNPYSMMRKEFSLQNILSSTPLVKSANCLQSKFSGVV